MTRKIVIGSRAQADFENLFTYLVPRAGEKAAETFVESIHAHCRSFDTFPERGIKRDDIKTGLRIVGYRRQASIAFSVTSDTVYILRVFMRGMNFGDPADFES
jgi:toxin ParE1/3/4